MCARRSPTFSHYWKHFGTSSRSSQSENSHNLGEAKAKASPLLNELEDHFEAIDSLLGPVPKEVPWDDWLALQPLIASRPRCPPVASGVTRVLAS